MAKKIKRPSSFITVIACILVSFALWTYVVYSEKPTDETWIKDVPVSLLNADVFKANGYVLLSSDTPTVDVKIRGPKNVVSEVTANDLKATYDLSLIKDTGTLYSNPTVVSDVSGVSVVDKRNSSTILTIDAIVSAEVDVKVNVINESEDEKLSVSSVLPAKVTVSGPSKYISSVGVEAGPLDAQAASKSGSAVCPLHLVFGSEQFDHALAELSVDSVTVEYDLLATKTVPIEAPLVGQNDALHVTVQAVMPQTIEIYGPSERLGAINAIQTQPISVSDITQNATRTCKLVFPAGISAKEQEADVQLRVEPRQKG